VTVRDPWLAVLTVLRVKGRGDAPALATASGVPSDACAPLLADGVVRGVLAARDGGRYTLTDEGRRELAGALERTPVDRAALEPLYAEFLVLDATLKADVTRWQEARSPEHLHAVQADATAAITLAARLAACEPRYEAYERRFDAALVHLGGGDERFVAHPAVDSLHQIWFELHEDLLLVLGRARDS
jgi:pyruvate,orthophosphate dikinase